MVNQGDGKNRASTKVMIEYNTITFPRESRLEKKSIEKVNKSFQNILMDKISELNNYIYSRAKTSH